MLRFRHWDRPGVIVRTCAFSGGAHPGQLYASLPSPATRLQPCEACADQWSADQWGFTKPVDPWEDGSMRKLTITVVNLLAAGMMLIGNAQAQQTPAAKAQQPPAAKAAPAPAAGAQKAPAAKTGPAAKPRTQSVLTLKTQKD